MSSAGSVQWYNHPRSMARHSPLLSHAQSKSLTGAFTTRLHHHRRLKVAIRVFRQRLPHTHLVLMALLPRGSDRIKPQDNNSNWRWPSLYSNGLSIVNTRLRWAHQEGGTHWLLGSPPAAGPHRQPLQGKGRCAGAHAPRLVPCAATPTPLASDSCIASRCLSACHHTQGIRRHPAPHALPGLRAPLLHTPRHSAGYDPAARWHALQCKRLGAGAGAVPQAGCGCAHAPMKHAYVRRLGRAHIAGCDAGTCLARQI